MQKSALSAFAALAFLGLLFTSAKTHAQSSILGVQLGFMKMDTLKGQRKVDLTFGYLLHERVRTHTSIGYVLPVEIGGSKVRGLNFDQAIQVGILQEFEEESKWNLYPSVGFNYQLLWSKDLMDMGEMASIMFGGGASYAVGAWRFYAEPYYCLGFSGFSSDNAKSIMVNLGVRLDLDEL